VSIATEITRLQKSKNDIKAAIEEKGVTVGDGTIDTYANLISQISVGGGGLKYASGTVEFANTNTSSLVFYHNLGAVPRIVLVWTEDFGSVADGCLGCIYSPIPSFGLKGMTEIRNGSVSPASVGDPVPELTDTYATLKYRSGSYKYIAGVTYNWLVIE
jgi:hypothetical protein